MTYQARCELIKAVWARYRKAEREEKSRILDELCETTGMHRKYVIQLLNQPKDGLGRRQRRSRGPTYDPVVIEAIVAVWRAAGHPWSVRLKAMLELWLPWVRKRFPHLTDEQERQLLAISARQIDRRLRASRQAHKHSIYNHTKPGVLLKRQIPVRTDNWDITEPGFIEIDLVAHCGPSASGEYIYSMNTTDIQTQWVETRAIMGKSEAGVVRAIEEMRGEMPFVLRGIDSDNGSEFINYHLYDYCQEQAVQFTRGRPYKKNDNAHIEQKNWTHVRKMLAWDRYDSPEALAAINDLYRNELKLMMNLFQPVVKLVEKQRIDSKVKRVYEAPRTPLDRLADRYKRKPEAVRRFLELRSRIDPFELSKTIEMKLKAIYELRRK